MLLISLSQKVLWELKEEARPQFRVIDVFLKSHTAQATNAKWRAFALRKMLLYQNDTAANSGILLYSTEHTFYHAVLVLSRFLFLMIHCSFDMYYLFRFGPMHVLFLEISELLKECPLTMLRDAELATSAMKIKYGFREAFKSIKRSFLQYLDGFLRKVFCVSPTYELGFTFAHQNLVCLNTKRFCDQGPTKMLEARQMDDIDKVSPFLGAIVDASCGNELAVVTRIFSTYIDMVKYFYQRDELIGESKVEREKQQAQPLIFEILGRKVFF